jgi:hypothetical protein
MREKAFSFATTIKYPLNETSEHFHSTRKFLIASVMASLFVETHRNVTRAECSSN